MFGLRRNKPGDHDLVLRSANRLLPEIWTQTLDEHVVDLRWSPDGTYVAGMPSVGRIGVFHAESGELFSLLPSHKGGNGGIDWHPECDTLATYGQDSTIRIYASPLDFEPREIALERGWADRIAWNSDGSLLAAVVGKSLFILDGVSGDLKQTFSDHKSTVCDISWNPKRSLEIASVCDGGARMWRVGEDKPIGDFDWGGASLLVSWSPDGRWVVTGDQLPSVHVYDTGRKYPLHIQGYETKVKALAWQSDSAWLATGGASSITVWPTTGKKGPQNATPIVLEGHIGLVESLDFQPSQPVLVSGGRDGIVLLWLPLQSKDPALVSQCESEITKVRWSPDGLKLAVATASGQLTVHSLQ
jgi:WD40 repeat protein